MMQFCSKCGASLKEGSEFCDKCGAKVTIPQQAATSPSAQPPTPQTPPVRQPAPPPPPVQQPATPPPPGAYPGAAPQSAAHQHAQHAQHAPPRPASPQASPPAPPPGAPQQAPQPAAQPQVASGTATGAKPAKRKMSAVVLALIIAVPLLIGGGFGIYFLTRKDAEDPVDPEIPTTQVTTPEAEKPLPFVSYTYQNATPEPVIHFSSVDSVFPSSYRTLDALLTFTGYCDYGEVDVLIEAEIPGFTQPYRQMVHLGRQITSLRILPPLITGDLDLNSEKTAQLTYSVKETESGKLLIQESKNIKLFSKYDMVWYTEEFGDANTDEILAWMTPDAPEILQVSRAAIDYLEYLTDGAIGMMVGYQDYGIYNDVYNNTWLQAVAIQGALSDIIGVRYNNSSFSMDAQQRVKLPADTVNSRSGLCIETTLVVASALQSAGMHVMLVFPPGHAQVAVEAWPNTGDYFLIETTVLPMPATWEGWDSAIMYLDKDLWYGYLSGEGPFTYGPCYVVDCDLGAKLGIRAMTN